MRTVKGEIEFKENKIDVTDPCYDSDVWCRKQVFITPGKYIYTVKLEQEQNCEIVSQLKIQLKNAKSGVRSLREVGTIGVDAGLAGFFEDKPDYNDEDWKKVVDMILACEGPAVLKTDKESPFGCNGIVVSSGYGDGVYRVLEIIGAYGKRLGYRIDFT